MHQFRLFVPDDFQLIESWHVARGLHFTGCDIGVILEEDNQPRAGLFAFINQTGEIAFLNAQITHPDVKPNASYDYMILLTSMLEDMLKEMGVKIIISIGESGYGKLVEKMGYKTFSTRMTESVKLL